MLRPNLSILAWFYKHFQSNNILHTRMFSLSLHSIWLRHPLIVKQGCLTPVVNVKMLLTVVATYILSHSDIYTYNCICISFTLKSISNLRLVDKILGNTYIQLNLNGTVELNKVINKPYSCEQLIFTLYLLEEAMYKSWKPALELKVKFLSN